MNAQAFSGMIRETGREWAEHDTSRLAAALSYYTAVSLAPLLVLVVALAGLVAGDDRQIRAEVIGAARSAMGTDAARLVGDLIASAAHGQDGTIATIVSVGIVIAGATGVFVQLKAALNEVWEAEPPRYGTVRAFVTGRFASFALVLGMSFLLLASLVISAALSFVSSYLSDLSAGTALLSGAIEMAVSFSVTAFVFASVYKTVPDTPVRWRDVWAGALGAAALFTVGKELLSMYLGRSSAASVYGAAGSLVVILVWVYYSAQVLFLGAEFTHVWAQREKHAA